MTKFVSNLKVGALILQVGLKLEDWDLNLAGCLNPLSNNMLFRSMCSLIPLFCAPPSKESCKKIPQGILALCFPEKALHICY